MNEREKFYAEASFAALLSLKGFVKNNPKAIAVIDAAISAAPSHVATGGSMLFIEAAVTAAKGRRG